MPTICKPFFRLTVFVVRPVMKVKGTCMIFYNHPYQHNDHHAEKILCNDNFLENIWSFDAYRNIYYDINVLP